jgi:hypothetical protein
MAKLAFMIVALMASLTALYCGSGETQDQNLICDPFDSRICALPSGEKGLTTCAKDGLSWSTCDSSGCGPDNMEICAGKEVYASDSCGNITQDTPKRYCLCVCTNDLANCNNYDDPLAVGTSLAQGCQYQENVLTSSFECLQLQDGTSSGKYFLWLTLINTSDVPVRCYVSAYGIVHASQNTFLAPVELSLAPGEHHDEPAYGEPFDDAATCTATNPAPVLVSYRCIDATQGDECLPPSSAWASDYGIDCRQ